MKNCRLIAPDIDYLLRWFDRGYSNPSIPSEALCAAMDPLFEELKDLAPHKKNDELKSIWLMIPRGTIDDYYPYEDMLELGEVENREEYEKCWQEDYPEPVSWYELLIAEGFNRDGSPMYRFVGLGEKIIINASLDERRTTERPFYYEEAAITLCGLLKEAAKDSMKMLREGGYNAKVAEFLPYEFRTGVIDRAVLWERDQEMKDYDLDGLSPETISSFASLIKSGINDKAMIGRLKNMTANDFYRACAIGYIACGFSENDLSPEELYFEHADGRDEGLSGRGYGLNAGPGVDPDDPAAWDEWYFHGKQGGGHPWEVVRGGNSTHVDLYVCHDQKELDYLRRTGKITDEEHQNRSGTAGYYYMVAGKYRVFEAVSFYVVLSEAGLPVILSDSEQILNRLEGRGYYGIVPHDTATRYCEGLFPERYGRIIDFMHVYDEEMEAFGDAIEWLPEPEAKLIDHNNAKSE